MSSQFYIVLRQPTERGLTLQSSWHSGLRPTGPTSKAGLISTVISVFGSTGSSRTCGPFLCGDSFTAADVAWAPFQFDEDVSGVSGSADLPGDWHIAPLVCVAVGTFSVGLRPRRRTISVRRHYIALLDC